MLSIALGVITLWSGAIGNIPPGWQLCDGTNGTPDMRDRFMISAGPSFSVNDTGGAVNNPHDFTGDGHSHIFSSGVGVASGANSIALSTTAISGTTGNQNTPQPPFYALAYIQFLGV